MYCTERGPSSLFILRITLFYPTKKTGRFPSISPEVHRWRTPEQKKTPAGSRGGGGFLEGGQYRRGQLRRSRFQRVGPKKSRKLATESSSATREGQLPARKASAR